jgi:hypothetical protein
MDALTAPAEPPPGPGPAAGARPDDPGPEPGRGELPAAPRLRDLLGGRRAVALFRVRVGPDGAVRLDELGPPPADGPRKLAVDAVRGLLLDRLGAARRLLSDPEWEQLVSRAGAGGPARAKLIARLAVKGSDKVGGYTPNNVGLERFEGLYAVLPDGTPFRVKLLLEGGVIGKRSADKDYDLNPWSQLLRSAWWPDARPHLLDLIRGLLAEEREEVAAGAARGEEWDTWSDEELADRINRTDDEKRLRPELVNLLRRAEQALAEPARLTVITVKHVQRLREKLKAEARKAGGPDPFPKRSDRRKGLAAELARAGGAGR